MSSRRARKPLVGYGLYLLAAALFGFNGTVSKTLLATGISAARLSQLRATLACVVLLAIVLASNRARLRISSWAELRVLAVFGIAGVMMTQFMYFYSIHLIPVGISLIIEYTAPFMVAIWLRLAKGRAIGPRVLVGMAVAFLGLVLIAQVWQGMQLNSLGVLFAWGAAVSLSVYFVMGEVASSPPYNRDPLSVTLFGFAGSSLVWAVVQPWWSFPWHYLSGLSEPWGNAGWRLPLWTLVAFMVLLGTVATFWLVLLSFRHLTAAQASSFGMAEPVLASIIAWLLIGESLSGWQVIGIGVAALGILYAERSRTTPMEFVE